MGGLDFTFSKSALLRSCAYPFRSDAEIAAQSAGVPAQIGTIVQATVTSYVREDAGVGPAIEAMAAALDSQARERLGLLIASAKEWVLANKRVGWRMEIKYAWSPSRDEARELPPAYDADGTETLRDYSAKRGDEVCGSVDIVSMDGDGIVVYDIKTGVTPLEVYVPQVTSLALAAARAAGVDKARAVLVKIHDDGPPTLLEVGPFDSFDICTIAGELAGLLSLDAPEPIVSSGCVDLYCPAKVACPASVGAATELVPVEALARHRMSTTVDGPDHAAWMVERVRLVEAACGDVKAAIKRAVPDTGWALADGRVLREGHCQATGFDRSKALALCKQLGATPAQIASLYYGYDKSTGLRITNRASMPRMEKEQS